MKLVLATEANKRFFHLLDDLGSLDVEVVPALDEDSLRREIVDADAVYGWPSPEALARAEKLSWVHTSSAGVEQLWSHPQLRQSDIVVTNSRGAHAANIAEHALAMLLAFSRGIIAAREYQAAGQWAGTEVRAVSWELSGSTMGIIGYGNIGRATGARAQALGMKVLAVDREPVAPDAAVATVGPLAKLAALAMAGRSLSELDLADAPGPAHFAVKEAVFPFRKFPGVDTLLGPEMRSTGEVMGIAGAFPDAFWKAQEGAGNCLPTGGCAFVSVRDEDKAGAAEVAGRLSTLGFSLLATRGTAAYLRARHIECDQVNKVLEGQPHIVDRMKNGEVHLVVNTTTDRQAIDDSFSIRRQTVVQNIPYFTTISAARAACAALGRLREGVPGVRSLQEYVGEAPAPGAAAMEAR